MAARQAAPALNPAGKHCGRDTEPRSGTGNSRQTASCKVSTSDGRTRPHAGHPYASKPPQKPPLAHLPITRTTRISNQQRWHQERKNERTNSSQGRLARAAWRTRADPRERERDLVTVAARQAAPALNPAGKHCGRDTEPRSGTGNSRQTASCKVSTSDGRTRPHAGHPYASKPPQKPPLAHLPITRTTRISNQQRWHQERKNERTNSSQGRLARAAWRTRADPRLRTKRGGPPPRHPSPCGANPRPQSPAARPRT